MLSLSSHKNEGYFMKLQKWYLFFCKNLKYRYLAKDYNSKFYLILAF